MKEVIKTISALKGVFNVTAVGSRISCSPPPTDTDADFLVEVVPKYFEQVRTTVMFSGFTRDGADWGYDDTRFESYRQGDVNLILTKDADFAEMFKRATSVCKYLNIRDKVQRVEVFRLIRDEALM